MTVRVIILLLATIVRPSLAQEHVYEVRNTDLWENEIYGGRLGELYHNDAFVDSIDLALSVQHIPGGIIYLSVHSYGPSCRSCINIGPWYFFDGSSKVRLGEILPRFADFYSTPVVFDSVIHYWGFERQENGWPQGWAMRYDPKTGVVDSLHLGSLYLEGDARNPLGTPRRVGDQLIFGGWAVAETWKLASPPGSTRGPVELGGPYRRQRADSSVFRLRLAPGDSTPFINYPRDVLYIVISGSRVREGPVLGEPIEREWRKGDIILLEAPPEVVIARTLTNTGSTLLDALAVELSDAPASPWASPAPADSAGPTLAYEDPRIRVHRVELAPDAVTAEHKHDRPGFTLVLSDGRFESQSETNLTIWLGEFAQLIWHEDPLTHYIRNISANPILLYEVEGPQFRPVIRRWGSR